MASNTIYIKHQLNIPQELEADIIDIPTTGHNNPGINNMYSQTCIKMSSLRQRKHGLTRQLISYKRFNLYEIFYDRKRKKLPLNRGDHMCSYC